MACISAPTALIAGSSALSAGASLFGANRASDASVKAAQIQALASLEAGKVQADQFDRTSTNLAPFLTAGQTAIGRLSDLVGTDFSGANSGGILSAPLTSPISTSFTPTPGQLERTPGYQFILQQGKKAVGNQMAAAGLAGSGAAGVGLTNYAEGLAGTTFQQQFQNWLSSQNLTLAQRQQIYNMVGGIATTGQNAGANLGGLGLQTAGQVGNSLTSGAAASAAGVVGSANALNAGLTNTTGAVSNAALLLALNNAGMFGSSGSSTTSTPAMNTDTTSVNFGNPQAR